MSVYKPIMRHIHKTEVKMTLKNLKLEQPAMDMLNEIARKRKKEGNPVRTRYAIGAEAIENLYKKENRKKKEK